MGCIRRFRGPVTALVALSMVTVACGSKDKSSSSSSVAVTTTSAASGDVSTTSAGQQPVELRTVTVAVLPGQGYRVPIRIAQDQGFFADRGIELKFVDQPMTIGGIQGIEAVGADLGYISLPTIAQSVQAGADSRMFCQSLPVMETSLVAKPGTDLPSTDDGASADQVFSALAGKKIGVQTPIGAASQLIFQKIFKDRHIDNVTYINTGVQLPVLLSALDSGDVDAIQVTPSTTQQMMSEGLVKRLIYLPDHVDSYRFSGSGMAGRQAFIENTPDLAAGYCDAIQAALDYINNPANANEVDAVLEEDMGLTPEAAALMRAESFPLYSTKIDEAALNRTLGMFVELGILKPEPAMTYDSVVAIPKT